MTIEAAVQMVFTALIGGGIVAMVWQRLDRIETELASLRESQYALREAQSGFARREDLDALREAQAGLARREDVNALREDVNALREAQAGLARREDIDVLRSDLTQVALAVGAGRPHASPG